MFLAVILLTGGLQAAKVLPETAAIVARNFMDKQGRQTRLTLVECGVDNMYLFAATYGGFVLVAGDDCVSPILAYSMTAPVINPLPENVTDWILGYDEEINRLRASGEDASSQVRDEWEMLLKNTGNGPLYSVVVSPLLATTWKQGSPYNTMCPLDSLNRDTKAGCVAIALAQVMKYWNHPAQGEGSYSYSNTNCGTMSANFGATTYDWVNMSNNLTSVSPTLNVNAVATLVYHAGVSVKMKYGNSSSSATTVSSNNLTTITGERALRTYFKYDKALHSVRRDAVGDSTWKALLDAELMASRPVIFSGHDVSGGHAFVCDGGNDAGFYHFNWGWGGYCDGYYQIGALNPAPGGDGGNATSHYNLDNKMIIGIRPDTVVSGTHTITALPDNPLHGSVTGGGSYSYGDTVQLTALAADGYRFVHWSDGMSYNLRNLIMGGDMTVTAVYDQVCGDTLRYDNGVYVNAWGYSTAQPFYWGMKIEPNILRGHSQLNAVQAYLKEGGTYSVFAYNGTTPQEINLLDSMSITALEEGWTTFQFDSALTINNTMPIWLVLYNDNITYPACAGVYCGHQQGAYSGTSWTPSTSKRTFLIRGIFTTVDLPAPVYDTTITEACGSFEWENTTYTESGTYERMFVASTGGDSLRVLVLTIYPEYHHYDTVSAVDSFLWVSHQVYTESGVYDFDTVSIHGCDSLLTLVLTITPSNPQGIGTMDNEDVVLYPIPTSGMLYFGFEVDGVEIFDVIGRQVFNRGRARSIDITVLPIGIYMIKLRLADGTIAVRRIEKR